MGWINFKDIDNVNIIKKSDKIQVYCINLARYITLIRDNDNFINDEFEINIPKNWIVKENRYLIQDPYLKDCLFVVDRIFNK